MTQGPRTARSRETVSRGVTSPGYVEQSGEAHGPRWTWLFFAGPLLWIVYFQVSSESAALGCTPDVLAIGVWSLVGVMGAAVLTIGLYSRRSGGSWALTSKATRQALIIGTALLTVTILFGLPVLFSGPC